MLFKTNSAAVFGIDAYLVEVEVDTTDAYQPFVNIVGLPDNVVRESRERIRAALRDCGLESPSGKGVYSNAQMPPKLIRKYCAIKAAGEQAARNCHRAPRPFRPSARPYSESLAHHPRPRRLGRNHGQTS